MHYFFLFIYLIFGGILGGLLTTMASMASLATYPFLLSVGIPPVYANTTNDAALIWSGISSAISSRQELKGHWRELFFYALFSATGSAIGCLLLISFSGKTFEKVVPFCIAFSGILVLVSDKLRIKNRKSLPTIIKILFFLAIIIYGIYNGYFGAAAGVMLLAILNIITDYDFYTYNAMKNIIAPLNNFVALIIYMFTEKIYWLAAVPLAIGMFIGAYIGPKLLRHLPVRRIKIGIAILALIQAGYYAYTAYFK